MSSPAAEWEGKHSMGGWSVGVWGVGGWPATEKREMCVRTACVPRDGGGGEGRGSHAQKLPE